MQTCRSFRSVVAPVVSLAVAVLTVLLGAGCQHTETPLPQMPPSETRGPSGSGTPSPSAEVWVQAFRAELRRTERRFVEARYMQNSRDPFYFGELLARAEGTGPVSQNLRNAIRGVREDYNDSLSLLTSQLERVERIFSVISVLVSYDATAGVSQMTGRQLPEVAEMFSRFRTTIQNGVILTAHPPQLDLSPDVASSVSDQAEVIGARVLREIDAAMASISVAESLQQLRRYKEQIQLLNPRAAALASQPLVMSRDPGGEDPVQTWTALQAIYSEALGIYALYERASATALDLDRARRRSTRDPSVEDTLVQRLARESSEARQGYPRLRNLRGLEQEKLQILSYTTERQFELSRTLLGEVSASSP